MHACTLNFIHWLISKRIVCTTERNHDRFVQHYLLLSAHCTIDKAWMLAASSIDSNPGAAESV